jgi:hypothetical protein
MALPPDLSRIGDELAAAAARSLRARRRRAVVARALVTAVAGVLAFAAMAPGRLGTAQSTGAAPAALLASSSGEGLRAGCDQPRGARFALTGCVTLAVTRDVLATLPHGTSLRAE